MSGFYYGHAAGADWREAADRSLQQLGTNGGTLGFLYVTDVIADHYADVLDLMREKTGVAHWVGATGIGVCANGVTLKKQLCVVADQEQL